MADTTNTIEHRDGGKLSRRLFLQGTATVSALLGIGAMPAISEAATSPVRATDPVFGRYVAFLAHEHRAALIALHRDHYERNADLNPVVPMFWFPNDPDVELLITRRPDAERRARAVLHAVGLPVPLKSWF